MLPDDKESELLFLRNQVAMLEHQLDYLRNLFASEHPCRCSAPLLREQANGPARCRRCGGYIAAHYVITLQRQIGELRE